MPLTPLPLPPSRADSASFAARADAWNAAIVLLHAELNALGILSVLGNLDNTPIGQTTPRAGAFTTLSASGITTIGAGGATNTATSIVLNATSHASNGGGVQFQKGGSPTVFFGDLAAATGSGTGSVHWVYGDNPAVTYINNVERTRVASSGLAVTGNLSATGQITGRNSNGMAFFTGNGIDTDFAISHSTGKTLLSNTASSASIAVAIGGAEVASFVSGGLLVGATSGYAGARFISQASGLDPCVGAINADTAGTNHTLFFGRANGVDRFFVLGNGDVQNVNNSYGAISDIKLKENITDASPKLAKLLKVRIVNYNLITDPTHKQIGVIAQELEEISPGLIEETPDYANVEVEPAYTEVRITQRQKVEYREDVRYEILEVEGKWKTLPIRTTVEVPLFEAYPLFDEADKPVMEVAEAEQPAVLDEDGEVVTPFRAAVYRQVMHSVPVMEDAKETVEIPAKFERQATGETTKSVKYSVFVPMLIKALQEQQGLIEALAARITALEAA